MARSEYLAKMCKPRIKLRSDIALFVRCCYQLLQPFSSNLIISGWLFVNFLFVLWIKSTSSSNKFDEWERQKTYELRRWAFESSLGKNIYVQNLYSLCGIVLFMTQQRFLGVDSAAIEDDDIVCILFDPTLHTFFDNVRIPRTVFFLLTKFTSMLIAILHIFMMFTIIKCARRLSFQNSLNFNVVC